MNVQSVIGPVAVDPTLAKGGTGGVELSSAGFVHLFWQPDPITDATDARAVHAAVSRMSRGGRTPLLVDISRAEAISHDARSIFTLPWRTSRVALLGSRPADRLVAILFLRAGTESCPVRFFTSQTEAMEWLAPEAVTEP